MGSVEEYMNQTKSLYPHMLHPRSVSIAYRIRTKFGRAGDLPNVITHAKFQFDGNKSVTFGEGLKLHV